MKQRSEENTALTNQITILEENRNQDLFEMNRIRNELLSTKEKLVTAETTCIEKLNDSKSKTNALAITSVALKELYAELNKCKKKIAMESNMSSIARQLFKNEKFNFNKPPKSRRYTEFIRNLAVNLSFYSQPGYEKLRTIFTLPSPSTIKKHLATVGCASGILKNALAEIEHKIKEKGAIAEATLSRDEMAIKKGIHWDSKLKKYFGFDEFPNVTSGNDPNTPSVATQALVFYLVAIDGSWKTPVAYYFTTHVNSKKLAELTKGILIESSQFDVSIRSIVFDGLPANIQMTTILGANLKIPEAIQIKQIEAREEISSKPLKPYFLHPSTKNVYMLYWMNVICLS